MTPAAKNGQGEHRVIATVGERPHQVTVTARIIRGKKRVVVEWRETVFGTVKRRLWVATAPALRDAEREAKAFAKAKHAILLERAAAAQTVAPAPITLRQLVHRYELAEGTEWAPNTKRNFTDRVNTFGAFVGMDTEAAAVTLETIDEFRAALRQQERSLTEVNRITQAVKAVYAFGVRRDLVVSKVPLYKAKKVATHQRRTIPEFTPEQVVQILGELRPRATIAAGAPHRPWRPWAVVLLAAMTSKRTRSQILPLRWDEISWRRGGASVHWVATRNKTRTPQLQPMPRRAAAVLRLVRWLLRREGYAGPLVFPAMETARVKVKGQPYSYTALHHHVIEACDRAGIERAPFQALHSFRRYAANQVLAVTGGDLKKAGLWLNDLDPRVLMRSYSRERDDDQGSVAIALPKPDKAPQTDRKNFTGPETPAPAGTPTLTPTGATE